MQTYVQNNNKGQLISKSFFCALIHPKNELENLNFCPSLLGQGRHFCLFFGRIESTKK